MEFMFHTVNRPNRPGCSQSRAGTTGLKLLKTDYVLGLQSFRTLLDFELNRLAFIQRAVAVRLNGREVNEDIFATLTLDEAVTLRGIEPLYCS